MASSSAPTRQLSQQRNAYGPVGRTGIAGFDMGWNRFIDDKEYVPELRWPGSVRTLSQMRTDSQLSGLYRAMTFPIRQRKILIDPNGARPEVVQGLSDDLNLDVKGQDARPRGRRKGRFSWDEYMRHALLAGIWGHIFFEQFGDIVDDLWRLRKLSPIMPDTIHEINVAPDGGLISLRQNLTRPWTISTSPLPYLGPEIKVDRLVGMVNEKEGPNWVGRSWFRDCYKNWLIKDRLLRVDAINHERAGGVPIAEAAPGTTPRDMEKLQQLTREFKVGEESGGAVPSGTKFNLHKVGSGTDAIGSIRYHDESMARMFLHMFIQLGQTETGSRALGHSFVEYAFIAQNAVCQWVLDTTNEHVLEDWVDWNFGEEEQVPLLEYLISEEDEHLAVTELVALVEGGLLTVDPELEDTLRERYKLPPRVEGSTPPQVTIPANLQPVAAEFAKREAQHMLDRMDYLDAIKTGRPIGLGARVRSLVRR